MHRQIYADRQDTIPNPQSDSEEINADFDKDDNRVDNQSDQGVSMEDNDITKDNYHNKMAHKDDLEAMRRIIDYDMSDESNPGIQIALGRSHEEIAMENSTAHGLKYGQNSAENKSSPKLLEIENLTSKLTCYSILANILQDNNAGLGDNNAPLPANIAVNVMKLRYSAAESKIIKLKDHVSEIQGRILTECLTRDIMISELEDCKSVLTAKILTLPDDLESRISRDEEVHLRTKITKLEREIEKLERDYNFLINIPSNSQYFQTE